VANGATLAEAEQAIREAINFHIEGMRREGTPTRKAEQGLTIRRSRTRIDR
jgi:predicted RNase H-like HicB family nuclease